MKDQNEKAIERVLALCERWDALTKGESPTTRAIRAALAGEDGTPQDGPTRVVSR